MMKGTPGEWYHDKCVGGYFNKNGDLVVCEEYNLTDELTDNHSVDVQNGDGYYNSFGKYVSFKKE